MDDAQLIQRWDTVIGWIETRFGKKPELEYILFLVGVQERGQGYQPSLDKDAKQALIMEGSYAVMATLGFYEQVGMNEDGAWIWEKRVPVPVLDIEAQEKLLRLAVLTYFETLLNENQTHETRLSS